MFFHSINAQMKADKIQRTQIPKIPRKPKMLSLAIFIEFSIA